VMGSLFGPMFITSVLSMRGQPQEKGYPQRVLSSKTFLGVCRGREGRTVTNFHVQRELHEPNLESHIGSHEPGVRIYIGLDNPPQ